MYQIRMEKDMSVHDHLNIFYKLITWLISIGVKIDDENKVLLLLTSHTQ